METDVVPPGLVQIGETLRAARETRGLSLDQAAAQLRCDLRVIDALERGRFEEVGPPVFARGHLLRYAALLGEPGEAMVEEWSQLVSGGTCAELMNGLHAPRGRDLRQVRRRLVTAAALLSLVSIAVWGLQNLPRKRASTVAPVAADATRPSAAAGSAAVPPSAILDSSSGAGVVPAFPEALAPAAPPTPSAPVSTAIPPAVPVAATEPPVRAVASAAGMVQLRFAFTADSWLEIYDVRNRRLFFGLATPGSPVDVQGRAPLKVIVGNALAVTVELNGRPAVVPPAAMRGPRQAAIRVNADGRLVPLPRA